MWVDVGGGVDLSSILARFVPSVAVVKTNDVSASLEHFVAHLQLIEAKETFVGHQGILSIAAFAEELTDNVATTYVAPVLQHVGRMIDVVEMQERAMGKFLECLVVIVLVGEPVGIDLPKHPLRSHLVETVGLPFPLGAVGTDLTLERVPQFVGDAVEFFVLHAVGGNPKGSDRVIVGATVGSAFERIVEHHHHTCMLGCRIGVGEMERVAEETVECLKFLFEIVEIHLHVVPFEVGSCSKRRAKAFLPEDGHVVGAVHAVETPFRIGVLQVHALQVLGDIDGLSFGHRHISGTRAGTKEKEEGKKG